MQKTMRTKRRRRKRRRTNRGHGIPPSSSFSSMWEWSSWNGYNLRPLTEQLFPKWIPLWWISSLKNDAAPLIQLSSHNLHTVYEVHTLIVFVRRHYLDATRNNHTSIVAVCSGSLINSLDQLSANQNVWLSAARCERCSMTKVSLLYILI